MSVGSRYVADQVVLCCDDPTRCTPSQRTWTAPSESVNSTVRSRRPSGRTAHHPLEPQSCRVQAQVLAVKGHQRRSGGSGERS